METVGTTPGSGPRAEGLATARAHTRALLETVVAVGDDVELSEVLRRVVHAACVLSDARYGALGVLGVDGRIGEFISHGLSEQQIERIGHAPHGHGVLGVLIRDPRPLRLRDLTQHPQSGGLPPHHPPMRSFLGVPILVRTSTFGMVYLAEKRGAQEFSEEDEDVIVALAAAAGVAIDNSRLYEAANRRQRWLEASVEIEQQLLAGVPRTQALTLVCERALALTRAHIACILLPDGPDELVVCAVSGSASAALGARLPADRSVSGAVMRTGAAEGVPDFSTDDRVASLRGAPSLGPGRVVPLVARGRPLGVLLVGRRPGEQQLTEVDSSMVDAFASQAAIAIELADLQEQRGSLAVYRDRERIARDMHDLVVQRVFGAGLTVQSMRPQLPADLQETGDQVVADLDAAIRELRAAIFALQRPRGVGGLRGRLAEAARAAVPALGYTPRVRLEGPLDTVVPAPVATHAASVLVEALTNVARHAQATAVTVSVRACSDRITLRVDDDGVGPPSPSVVTGNGLRNIRARAVELGGDARLQERLGGGTRLVWTVPLGPRATHRHGPEAGSGG